MMDPQLVVVFDSEVEPMLTDSLMDMCEWVSDPRESVRLANPCESRMRNTDVLCPHHVGSAYGSTWVSQLHSSLTDRLTNVRLNVIPSSHLNQQLPSELMSVH